MGLTFRQLDYSTGTGLITPGIRAASGSGSQREYSYQDLVALKTIKSLLDTGVSLQRVREAVAYLQGALSEKLSEVTLVSDGAKIHACLSDREVIDLLARGQGVFAIALAPVVDDLNTQLSSIDARRAERPTELPAKGLAAATAEGAEAPR